MLVSQESKKQHHYALLPSFFMEVLTQSCQQFRAGRYEITKIIAKITENKQIFNSISIHSESQNSFQENQAIPEQIMKDKLVLIGLIIGFTPKYFVEMLQEQLFAQETNIIDLNSQNVTIINRFLGDCLSKMQANDVLLQSFSIQNTLLVEKINEFLVIVAKKISEIYEKCTKAVANELERISSRTKNSQMMNSYLMFKLLRDAFHNVKDYIEEQLIEGIFRNCPSQHIQHFMNFVVEKFQNVYLTADKHYALNSHLDNKIDVKKFICNLEASPKFKLHIRNAMSEHGEFAILMKAYPAQNATKQVLEINYLIKRNQQSQQLSILNCKLIRQKWYVPKTIPEQRIFNLSLEVQNILCENQERLKEEMSKAEKSWKVIEEYWDVISIENVTNTGGTIGKCLAEIDQFTDIGKFYQELSKQSLLAESLQQVIFNTPIIGIIYSAGVYSAQFYQIFHNQVSTGSRKFKELSGMTVVVGTVIGSSIVGAALGQVLIPIPFVGAFIGTVVGGLFGTRGGNQINKYFQNQSFSKIIKNLKENIVDEVYWKYTKQMLELLEIKEKQFIKYIPQDMEDFVFITMICFLLVCIYQSKNQILFNKKMIEQKNNKNQEKSQKLQQNIKKNFEFLFADSQEQKQMVKKQLEDEAIQLQQEKKKQQKEQVVKDVISKNMLKQLSKEEQLEIQIKRLGENEIYKPEFNIIGIIGWLERNDACLIDHLEMLEKTMIPM